MDDKNVLILELVTDRLIIGEVEYFDSEPSIGIKNPYEIVFTGKEQTDDTFVLHPYPPLSANNSLVYESSRIMTMYPPSETVLDAYYISNTLILKDPVELYE